MTDISPRQKHKDQIYKIIFQADTPSGKLFDVLLIWSILISVAIVIIESVHQFKEEYQIFLTAGEWFFTILFSIEYLLRIYVIRRKRAYIFSFYGIVDFLAILPTYVSLILPGTHYLMVIRILRLMRIFRIFKLTGYTSEAKILVMALAASRRKIFVFFSTIAVLVVVIGAVMYVIEGPQYDFKDIPTSIYWAVVTLTTVGYGDISPQTIVGQFFSSVVMVLGYSIIAVPTGIMTMELSSIANKRKGITTKVCKGCLKEGHDVDAQFCKYCGKKFEEEGG